MHAKPPKPAAMSLRYPILDRTLRGLVAAFDPSFKYTNVTVNKNLPCKPHRAFHHMYYNHSSGGMLADLELCWKQATQATSETR